MAVEAGDGEDRCRTESAMEGVACSGSEASQREHRAPPPPPVDTAGLTSYQHPVMNNILLVQVEQKNPQKNKPGANKTKKKLETKSGGHVSGRTHAIYIYRLRSDVKWSG